MVSISFVVVGLVLLSFLGNMVPSMTRSALTVALLGVPFFALMGFHNGASNGFSRFAASFLPSNVIRPSLFLAVVLTAHWFGFEFAPDALVAVHVGVIVLISMGTFLALRKLLNSRFRQDNHEYETRLWIKTSSQLLLITLFVNNFAELCVILVGFFLPSDQVAIFHVGFRLALLISFALQSVDSFAAPQLSKLWAQKDDARFVAVVNRTARLQFWVTLLAVGCLALAGHRLLAIFGPEFVDGYRIMIILAGMQLVRAYVGPVSLLISISGYQHRSLPVVVITLLVAAGLISLLASNFGIDGAAVGAFTAFCVWNFGLRFIVTKHMGVTPRFFQTDRAQG